MLSAEQNEFCGGAFYDHCVCPIRLHATGFYPLAFWCAKTFSRKSHVYQLCLCDCFSLSGEKTLFVVRASSFYTAAYAVSPLPLETFPQPSYRACGVFAYSASLF